MTHPHFFGYGSLVNRATHDYPNARIAVALGWRRAWVHTTERPFAFLTAVRTAGQSIEGLIAEVPNADWDALDAREHAYDRIEDSDNIHHDHPQPLSIAIYAVPTEIQSANAGPHPILLSYLDVVLQGYLREFGREGAEKFIASTDGWRAPVLNDRAAPIYSRHQKLTASERNYVDSKLRQLGSNIVTTDR